MGTNHIPRVVYSYSTVLESCENGCTEATCIRTDKPRKDNSRVKTQLQNACCILPFLYISKTSKMKYDKAIEKKQRKRYTKFKKMGTGSRRVQRSSTVLEFIGLGGTLADVGFTIMRQ